MLEIKPARCHRSSGAVGRAFGCVQGGRAAFCAAHPDAQMQGAVTQHAHGQTGSQRAQLLYREVDGLFLLGFGVQGCCGCSGLRGRGSHHGFSLFLRSQGVGHGQQFCFQIVRGSQVIDLHLIFIPPHLRSPPSASYVTVPVRAAASLVPCLWALPSSARSLP